MLPLVEVGRHGPALYFFFILAFVARAKAAAREALIALARRSSGLMFSARALPPTRPSSLKRYFASAVSLIFLLFVLDDFKKQQYTLGVRCNKL